MRSYICSIVALLVLAAMAKSAPAYSKPIYDIGKAPELFEKFIKDYNKEYKNQADKEVHYLEFVKTLKEINKLNTDPSQGSGTFGINAFADYTPEERKTLYGFKTD